MQNPLYEGFQALKLQPQLEADLVRWLAWEQMGTGILANWLVLPMGPWNDPILSHLRKGDYTKLSRYQQLGSALCSGEKNAINAAIVEALKASSSNSSKTLLDVVAPETVSVEPKPQAVAFYEANIIAEQYKSISNELTDDKAAGLRSLAQLLTSHLHLIFLNSFPDGFAVLTPYSDNANILNSHARSLADALRDCPSSPVPSSCPPNRQKSTPCSSIRPPPVRTPEYLTNDSTPNSSRVYTIGTIPHPFTLSSLIANTKDITTRHIRRDTKRDRWLCAVTQQTLGEKVAGYSRIVSFKETVAGEAGSAHGIWMTEDPAPDHKDLEYHFGFELAPFNVTTPDPESFPLSKKEKKAVERAMQQQKDLLANAKVVLKQQRSKKEKTGVKEMVEAWNLADTEAWRFVRAFQARERVERLKWEQEERAFAGAEEGKDGGWGKWFDRLR